MFNSFRVGGARCRLLAGALCILMSGAASACVDEEAVVNLDLPEDAHFAPCNYAVYLYAHSLGVDVQSLLRLHPIDLEHADEYPFYYAAKGFLLKSRPEFRGYEVELAVRLAAILAVADETPPERRGAYKISAKYHMLQLNVVKIEGLASSFVVDVEAASTHPALDTLEKNLCFVEADMPTLTVAQIVESEVYRDCLSETK